MYSAPINWGATWDLELVSRIGKEMGVETRILGFNLLLDPGINISRTPYGGKNFESFGEDPFLMSRIVVPLIKGVQSKNVVTCTKHFVANNQEWNRFDVDVRVDERALHEIYFPAFKAAVQKADTWSIMGAYNIVNGDYCNANKYLLNDVLKENWGFSGIVISDWGAVWSTVKTAKAGLDLEMPNGKYLEADLFKTIKNGEVDENLLNPESVRIWRISCSIGLLSGVYKDFQNTHPVFWKFFVSP